MRSYVSCIAGQLKGIELNKQDGKLFVIATTDNVNNKNGDNDRDDLILICIISSLIIIMIMIIKVNAIIMNFITSSSVAPVQILGIIMFIILFFRYHQHYRQYRLFLLTFFQQYLSSFTSLMIV